MAPAQASPHSRLQYRCRRGTWGRLFCTRSERYSSVINGCARGASARQMSEICLRFFSHGGGRRDRVNRSVNGYEKDNLQYFTFTVAAHQQSTWLGDLINCRAAFPSAARSRSSLVVWRGRACLDEPWKRGDLGEGLHPSGPTFESTICCWWHIHSVAGLELGKDGMAMVPGAWARAAVGRAGQRKAERWR